MLAEGEIDDDGLPDKEELALAEADGLKLPLGLKEADGDKLFEADPLGLKDADAEADGLTEADGLKEELTLDD